MCRPFKVNEEEWTAKMSITIVPRSVQAPKRRSRHFREGRSQGCEIFAPLPTRKASPYLQIASVRAEERINQRENRYILLIQPQGIRACGGQFTADEAHQITKAIKAWDWTLDGNNRPYCLPALESLLDSITQRSSQGGKQ
jgi:hypothetical protein